MRTGTLAARLAVAGLLLLGTACARQAVVESDGGGGGIGTATAEQRIRFELEQLGRAQNDHFLATGRYADSLADLPVQPPAGMRIDILQGDRDGFSAIGRTDEAECAIYSGSVRQPRNYVTRPDVVGCRP